MKGVSEIGGIGRIESIPRFDLPPHLRWEIRAHFEFPAEIPPEFANESQASNDFLRFLAATSHVSLGNPSFFSRLLPYGVTFPPQLRHFFFLLKRVSSSKSNRPTLRLASRPVPFYIFLPTPREILSNDSPLFGSTINSSPSKKKRKNRDITRITWTHYTNYNKSTKIWRIIRDNSRLSREITSTSERG